jgi:non-homologous end joining protein Ku
VISAAITEAGMAGLGRLTLSRRERMVMVEPRGAGMALITLRAPARSGQHNSILSTARSIRRQWRSRA